MFWFEDKDGRIKRTICENNEAQDPEGIVLHWDQDYVRWKLVRNKHKDPFNRDSRSQDMIEEEETENCRPEGEDEYREMAYNPDCDENGVYEPQDSHASYHPQLSKPPSVKGKGGKPVRMPAVQFSDHRTYYDDLESKGVDFTQVDIGEPVKTAELGPIGRSWAHPDLAKQEMDWAATRRAAAPVQIDPITGGPFKAHVRPKEGAAYLWDPKPGVGPKAWCRTDARALLPGPD